MTVQHDHKGAKSAGENPQGTLSVTDDRTGETYELPVADGTVRAADLNKIKAEEIGLASYDPGLVYTATCRSAITFLDGDAGHLAHRGYPIEELAAQATFIEVAHLLLNGELPKAADLKAWERAVATGGTADEHLHKLVASFPRDAHPMSIMLSAMGALPAVYPELAQAPADGEPDPRPARLIALGSTIAAMAYRHGLGEAPVAPDTELSFPGNFMSMMWKKDGQPYEVDPRVEKALDVLWILHADHEQNCSTNAVRSVGSSGVDPCSAVAAGVAALYGPLHGGANEAVLNMLREIGDVSNVAEFMTHVKNGERRLMGFGHRVYKNYDPRATIIKKYAMDVLDIADGSPLLDIALELEKIALDDDYFVQRRLYPNVDFYSGLIYQALGIPSKMFTVMFAVPRVSGWVAQWMESAADPEQKIVRPRQIYTGAPTRTYIPAQRRD
ncbi:MAG: citrate synthase [Streptosporangiales bacterium]|nr:citrate synthase [Streptosporangiales bacterium]